MFAPPCSILGRRVGVQGGVGLEPLATDLVDADLVEAARP